MVLEQHQPLLDRHSKRSVDQSHSTYSVVVVVSIYYPSALSITTRLHRSMMRMYIK